jgi:hypothetical protein
MKDVLLGFFSIILLALVAHEFMFYNPTWRFSPKPEVEDMYLCNLSYTYSIGATHVTQVKNISSVGNMVRVISIPLTNVGGDVIQGITALDEVQANVLTMDNYKKKLKVELDNIDSGKPDWTTLYTLTVAATFVMGDNAYAVKAIPMKEFKRSCQYVSSSDIIGFWKSN